MDLQSVFAFLNEQRLLGLSSVLVTVCAVEGSSMRNPGAVMGVGQDGTYAGSLSGGCIENAVVAEALDALRAGQPRVVRFGAGSLYLDIKLPCGGGLDLHFAPLLEGDLAKVCLASIEGRTPFSIELSDHGARHSPSWQPSGFDQATRQGAFAYWPAPKLQIIGHGAGVEALCDLARSMGCDVNVLTPDDRIFEQLSKSDVPVFKLERSNQIGLLSSDVWTAFVFLFHDHDWEIDFIAAARRMPHFYLGAMGGRKAHAMRCDALRAKGITDDELSTIKAPLGVFHSSRDPHTLALSTLAEVIRTYQETDFSVAID